MKWEWRANDDLEVAEGHMQLHFTGWTQSFILPSFVVAQQLAEAIDKELAIARRDAALDLAEAIHGVIYQKTGDTR